MQTGVHIGEHLGVVGWGHGSATAVDQAGLWREVAAAGLCQFCEQRCLHGARFRQCIVQRVPARAVSREFPVSMRSERIRTCGTRQVLSHKLHLLDQGAVPRSQ